MEYKHCTVVFQTVLTGYSYHYPDIVMLSQIVATSIALEVCRRINMCDIQPWTLKRWVVDQKLYKSTFTFVDFFLLDTTLLQLEFRFKGHSKSLSAPKSSILYPFFIVRFNAVLTYPSHERLYTVYVIPNFYCSGKGRDSFEGNPFAEHHFPSKLPFPLHAFIVFGQPLTYLTFTIG